MKKIFICSILHLFLYNSAYAFDRNYADLTVNERKEIIYQRYADQYPFDFLIKNHFSDQIDTQVTDFDLLRAKLILAYYALSKNCAFDISDTAYIGKEGNEWGDGEREYIFEWVAHPCQGGTGTSYRRISSVTLNLESDFVNGESDSYMPPYSIEEHVKEDYFDIDKINEAYQEITGHYENALPSAFMSIASQESPDHYLIQMLIHDTDDLNHFPSIRIIYEFKRNSYDKWSFKELYREKLPEDYYFR